VELVQTAGAAPQESPLNTRRLSVNFHESTGVAATGCNLYINLVMFENPHRVSQNLNCENVFWAATFSAKYNWTLKKFKSLQIRYAMLIGKHLRLRGV
jgi:hypothetical protein